MIKHINIHCIYNKKLFSFREFEETFLEVLHRRFGTKRVHANIVYQEYISDRDHLHMNATQWETLTDLVKWLGKEGKASFKLFSHKISSCTFWKLMRTFLDSVLQASQWYLYDPQNV